MVVAGVRIDVRADGCFSVRRGDRVLVRNACLVLAGEGWRGSAALGALGAERLGLAFDAAALCTVQDGLEGAGVGWGIGLA
jgi:hypothetical protein